MVEARHDPGKSLSIRYSSSACTNPSTTGTCTKALVQVPAGKNLLCFGSMMSYNEWTALWAKILGVKATFVRLDRKIVEQAIPVIGEEYCDMIEYTGEFGYDGGDKTIVHPKDVSTKTVWLERRC